jgi:ActR/RegA family two-component response regulator
MPARIVIVNDDEVFTSLLIEKLGPDTALFTDPIEALATLEHAQAVEFLICRLQFDDLQPLGLSLARVVRRIRPDVRIIFTGDPHHRHHVRGLGEFIPEPVAPGLVAMIVEWLS